MEKNYRTNIAKWLPYANPILEKWFVDAMKTINAINEHVQRITLMIEDCEQTDHCEEGALEELISSLDDLINNYNVLFKNAPKISHSVFKYKFEHLSLLLKRGLNVLAKLTDNLLFQLMDWRSDDFLRLIFRLVNKYNGMLDLEHDVTEPSINLVSNDCPPMLQVPKKMSVTRILQVMAKSHAEDNCHILIDCLLTNYEPNSDEKQVKSPESADLEISENSSIEIYRALTKHMTPPMNNKPGNEIELTSNVESIESLVHAQTERVTTLVRIAKDISGQLLGSDSLKSTAAGGQKLRKSAIRKVTKYYQEIAWGAVSSILDHVVLWWSPEALAPRHSQGAHHLKDWLHQFIQGTNVSVRAALQNLCDALGCHVTMTAWDHLFRLAYISAFECQSRSSTSEDGTDTGQMFAEVFQLLVRLSNECEIGGEWVIGAPLMELALSEQIIVLHRLDHSVHTMRLWALQESKLIAHTWILENFFLLVKNDITNCLDELSYLKLADHTNALGKDVTSVQVYVCGKMRGKIVSEVNANVRLLKGSPASCIKNLASICRVVSLANLHMCFPPVNYWRNQGTASPTGPSSYVKIYFEKVLLPILEVVDDHEISNMILKIMCEAWLDYIYLHRIKFSELGALQLLTDFAFVTTWVMDCSIISQNVRNHLVKNEVLRRCEGVGRLLLRHPGEAINMHKKIGPKSSESSPESLGLERMPAEMYVPNQEQWLELRAPSNYSLCCTRY